MEQKQRRIVKEKKADQNYNETLMSIALTTIVNYSSRKLYLRLKAKQISQIKQSNLKSAALNALMQNLTYETIKKATIPLVTKIKL